MDNENGFFFLRLIGRMTSPEKDAQMSYDSPAIDRLGIPAYVAVSHDSYTFTDLNGGRPDGGITDAACPQRSTWERESHPIGCGAC